MKARGRALVFLLLAAFAAAGAAALADRYGASVASGFGPMRPVVVLRAKLGAGDPIGPREVATRMVVRRVPVRFAPPDALASPNEALGLEAKLELPAGSYLLGSQLRPPRRGSGAERRLARGRSPVEIAVGGAGALLAAGQSVGRVDVVVTAEPGGSGPGRTFVAAPAVRLLALRPGAEGEASGSAAATLALTRRQALRLIAAESYARKITLIPVG